MKLNWSGLTVNPNYKKYLRFSTTTGIVDRKDYADYQSVSCQDKSTILFNDFVGMWCTVSGYDTIQNLLLFLDFGILSQQFGWKLLYRIGRK